MRGRERTGGGRRVDFRRGTAKKKTWIEEEKESVNAFDVAGWLATERRYVERGKRW